MKKSIIRRPTSEHPLAFVEHPVLARVYAARGISSADQIERGFENLLPWQSLSGISQAVACLYEALKNKQSILVVGDFDADGATSSALAVSALQALGATKIGYLVPNRFEYGYGLTPEIVAVAKQKNPDWIITVDNGISSLEGVAAAKAMGIRVIITDHHLPGTVLPDADAIVNPNVPNDLFSSKNLAGVGVIFYVMLAFRSYLREKKWFETQRIPEPNMAQFLDLVALGTIADVVPLDTNNRILVHQGLQRIRAGKVRPGIRALLSAANREPENIVASDLGFAIGPRLNAAGRLDDMSLGIECLLATDFTSALAQATHLNALNLERREIEDKMQQEALTALNKLQLNKVLSTGLCLYDSTWHQGVIGILAGRLKDKLHRPVIVFALVGENELKGSARSVMGLHIRDALDAVATRHSGLITKFGGHAMAAGLSLKRSNYEDFSKAFNEEVERHLMQNDLQGKIYTDGELLAEYCDIKVAELLRDSGPWGQQFPEPVFEGRFRILDQRLVGNKHLKLILGLGENGQPIEAIAFNIDMKQWPNKRAEFMNIVYRLDINSFRGKRSVQLMVEHIIA
ncbi:MAG: single-stranded-DNA-specific exonuclease RecJ [Gammaproteobacteria bacterium]